jgi:acyl-CoA thioester hydrolase
LSDTIICLAQYLPAKKIFYGFMEAINKIVKKIYYHDTDCGGVVYYSNYLKYFEEARTEFLKCKGVDIKELAKENVYFLVRHVDIDYKARACYGDVLDIFTTITDKTKVTLNFFHEAKRNNSLLVVANTQLVCVGNDFKPVAIPDKIILSL